MMTSAVPLKLERRSSKAGWLATAGWLLLLSLFAIVPYLNSLKNGYTYDDIHVVQYDDRVISGEWLDIWNQNYWTLHDGSMPDVLYRPLTTWTYVAGQAVTPDCPAAFHAVNILLHALVTVLVAVLAWKLFEEWWVAAIAGVLFGIHPLHTEVVANIVGRAELMASLWMLLALIIYLPRTLKNDDLHIHRSYAHGILVAICFFAAILSKETPAALVGMLPCIDLWRWWIASPTNRPSLKRWLFGQALRYWLPVATLFAVYLAMRIHATGLMSPPNSVHPLVNPLMLATVWERILTPFELWAKYLSLIFWPVVLRASYSAPSLMPAANPFAPLPLVGWLSVGLASLLGFRLWRKAPAIALTLVLMVLSYALVANVIRIGTIFGERLFYAPSIFVLIVLAWLAVTGWRKWASTRALQVSVVAMALIACTLLSVRTWRRNDDWQSNIALALATARDGTDDAKACYWAGIVLRSDSPQQWMKDFGQTLLERAVELYPIYSCSHWELAKCYGIKNDFAPMLIQMAWASYYTAGHTEVRLGIQMVADDIAHRKDRKFMDELKRYSEANPKLPIGPYALGIAYGAYGEDQKALACFKQAIAMDNRFHEAASELADVEFRMGQADDAMRIYRIYLTANETSIDGHCLFARHLMNLDRVKYPKAMIEASQQAAFADRLSPNSPKIRELRNEIAQKMLRVNAEGTNKNLPKQHGPVASLLR